MISLPRKIALFWLMVSGLLAACDPQTRGSGSSDLPEPGVLEATRDGPPGATVGSCWGKTVTPAVIQTVSKQVQIKPAKVNPDGTIGAPPKYRTTQTQEIVSPRTDNWFETPCADVLTAQFNASLQRALQARGFYAGAVNGEMDSATRAAVRAFQRVEGLDSSVLSLEAARRLGLIAVPRQPDNG